jgi:hypothetical protein
MAPALTCRLCGKDQVLQTVCRSAGERLLNPLGVSPFRCQFCTHRFLALCWWRTYPTLFVDRREHHRIPVRMTLSFSGNRVHGDGILLDISMGGCLVRSSMQVGRDEIYYLRIVPSEQEPPVELAAMVRSAGGRGIGFQFLRATREDQRLLDLLQRLDHAAPAKRRSRT